MNAVAEQPAAVSRIDELEIEIRRAGLIEPPLNHIFTPGLYVREICLPAGSLAISKIHRTEHPFVISAGSVSVWTPERGIERISAPHTGVTKPGTQRVIYAHEDTIWSTFHVTAETDVAKIEAAIIEPRANPLLTSEILKELQNA